MLQLWMLLKTNLISFSSKDHYDEIVTGLPISQVPQEMYLIFYSR